MIGCTLPPDDDNQDDENESTDIPVFVEKVAISRKYIPLSVWQCTVPAIASSVYDACQVYIPFPAMLRHAHSTRAQTKRAYGNRMTDCIHCFRHCFWFNSICVQCSKAHSLARSLLIHSLGLHLIASLTHLFSAALCWETGEGSTCGGCSQYVVLCGW